MPLVAKGKVMLDNIGHVLHDLCFDVSSDEFRLRNGSFSLRLSDQDSNLDEPEILEFDLTIHDVVSIEVHGEPRRDPGHDMFNKFEFDQKRGILALKCSMAINQIVCKVEQLRVELEQVGTDLPSE